jgi:O-antigen/teichoic acid export membrane protein
LSYATDITTLMPAVDADVPAPAPRGAVGGAAIIMASKIASLMLGLLATAFIARLVSPADYGLIAMVLSVTAFLTVPSDFGLSQVTVQKPRISQEQLSTLFWINLAFGAALGLIAFALAPLLVRFYHDTRLLGITFVVALTFPVTALGVQHEALVRRHMLFGRMAIVRLLATAGSGAAGIVIAWYGWGYWALACQSLMICLLSTVGAWLCYRWLPGLPRRCPELWQMLGFGGSLTAHGVASYFANSLDKVLLGRFCGASALGLYTNAYTLMAKTLAVTGFSIGEAAIPAMSRADGDPRRVQDVYRRMLQFTVLIGLPIGLVCIAWPYEVVLALLGPKYTDAAPLLRLLFLALLPRMVIASTGWVYIAGARPGRMLCWQLLWSPAAAAAFVIGLPWGAYGVAAAYAVVCWLALIPAITFCFHGTDFTRRDVLQPIFRPLLCALFAWAGASSASWFFASDRTSDILELALHVLVFALIYGLAAAWTVPLVRTALRKLRQRPRSDSTVPSSIALEK